MRIRCLIPALMCMAVGFSQPGKAAYVKYYLTRNDFLGDNAIDALERKGKDHWTVFFNEANQPIAITQINANGDTTQTDLLGYDTIKVLTQKYHYDSQTRLHWLALYGDDEAWSVAFRDWTLPENTRLSFSDQESRFELDSLGRISNIIFTTVDGNRYGRIDMIYKPDGRKSEEIWKSLPGGQVVRRYHYQFDKDGNPAAMFEYGRSGESISEVDLTLAPADRLYKIPPPKLGNRLMEAESIIQSINTSGETSGQPALLPVLMDDLVQLSDGQLLIGKIVSVDTDGLKFNNSGSETLTIPVERIDWARTRNGKYVIHQK